MAEPKFSVDTNLFRELGRLLVGRDSTALVELIKNSYDADAEKVIVHGQNLDDEGSGKITITDDGVGMGEEQFTKGFLRIASRLKDEGTRRSARYKRRYTGAKGIGRLAAHKLAKFIHVYSIPAEDVFGKGARPVNASIDWDLVEAKRTLDELGGSGAITVKSEKRPERAGSRTVIELQRLRRKWTPAERARFFAEVQTFQPPKVLIDLPSSAVQSNDLLFENPKVKDSQTSDPGFTVELSGELEAGEDYWQSLAQAAHWVVEIEARKTDAKVEFNIIPTKKGKQEISNAEKHRYAMEHPDHKSGPFFQARILIREGSPKGKGEEKAWQGRSSGIRVYMEGFRVLPYGEPSDDWLSIDADYSKRPKTFAYLSDLGLGESADEQEGLLSLRNTSYFGAVFLTMSDAPTLQMLVNREGFLPEQGYETLVQIMRTGIDLSVRVRAAAKAPSRGERREQRKQQAAEDYSRLDLQQAVEQSVRRASELANEARQLAAVGDFASAQVRINQAAAQFSLGSRTSERLITEGAMLRILASVGTQMTAFVHEINGILGSAVALEGAVTKIRENSELPASARSKLGQLHAAIADLRRSIERQATYLTDIVTPDARRRRARQKLAERFDAGKRLVEHVAQRRDIKIVNEIPPELKSPPMFKAELTLIFSNLLTNAIKAAGTGGKIRAHGKAEDEGILLRIENTGVVVDPKEGERWFKPFESTTVETDPVLGQGMGMGLPITRNMLEDYGATIKFVRPVRGYATALEITFPK